MKLQDYFEENDTNKKAFSRRLGVSYQTLFNYLAGRTQPAIYILEKITEITDGRVTDSDFPRIKKKKK